MKIMHLADFHLDSAFSGFSKEVADKKRADLRTAFENAMQVAKENNVKLILIPGDLFDTPFCSSLTRKTVFDAMKNVDCPIVIAPGNHDYYNKNGTYADKDLPENVFVFNSNELGRFDFDELGISVVGYAFTSDRYEEHPLADEVPLSSENVNILCAHTEIGTAYLRYAPMSFSTIAKHGFVYAALGHVHNPSEPMKIDNTLIAYSGFAQGRSFDELGDGGAYIVDINLESKNVTLDRVKLSSMRYIIEKIDITSLDNDEDVAKKIANVINEREYGEETALRIVLTGAVPSYYEINEKAISAELASSALALLQIKNETVANFDLAELEDDMTVRGEVYRLLLPSLNSDDEKERQKGALALKFALAALDKREFGI